MHLWLCVSIEHVHLTDWLTLCCHVLHQFALLPLMKSSRLHLTLWRSFNRVLAKICTRNYSRERGQRETGCLIELKCLVFSVTDVFFTLLNVLCFYSQLEEWWLDTAYLEIRTPSQLNVNFGGPAPYLEHCWPPAEGTSLQRASIITWHSLQYWNMIRT